MVHAVTPAGSSDQGTPLSVVEIRLPTPPADSDDAGQQCQDDWREIYLAEGEAFTSLLQLCNDGYGAAGMGEDVIEIGDNRLSHTQSGGSNWRWGGTTVYQLAPLRVLQDDWDQMWTVGLVYETGSWDWTDWSQGRTEWWAPRCAADGTVPLLGDDEPKDADITRAVLIPKLAEGAVPKGATKAVPGSCGSRISADNGYVIHGDAKAVAADGAWMTLLAADPNLLFVSVRTSAVVSGGKTWLSDDHIEIWQGPDLQFSDECMPFDPVAQQWAVRLRDGAVFAAAGEPKALPKVVSRSSTSDGEGGTTVTMALRLAQPLENITVVFSKGDGKKKQLWLLASSALQFKQAASLGDFFGIAPDHAACVIKDGRLEVKEQGRPVGEAE